MAKIKEVFNKYCLHDCSECMNKTTQLEKKVNQEWRTIKGPRFDNMHTFDPNYVLVHHFTDEEQDLLKENPGVYFNDKKLLKQLYIFMLPDKNGMNEDQEIELSQIKRELLSMTLKQRYEYFQNNKKSLDFVLGLIDRATF